ncbi:MAG: hypothetical protein AAFX06_13240 [Planctomycetota bacterium]
MSNEQRVLAQYVETQIQYYNNLPKAAEQIGSPELIGSISDAGTATALVSLARDVQHRQLHYS